MHKNHFYILLIASLIASRNLVGTQESIWQHIRYHNSKETLEQIMNIIAQKKKGVYLRFGDGDINLAMNRPDMFQRESPNLGLEMREALAMNGNNILKCLVLTNPALGLEPGMIPGKFASNDMLAAKLLQEAQQVWGGPVEDVYCPVALHFCSTDNSGFAIRFLHFLKSCKNVILVGNEKIPTHVKDTLFGQQCHFIKTPSNNSYQAIDRIEAECQAILDQTNEYHVVCSAMGCSGRALQKRLWKQYDNVFLFDFGSLMDALCGWDTRAWISISNFNKDRFLQKLSRNIHIICTAALIDNQAKTRQQEYKNALTSLVQFGFHPYVFESIKRKSSFLDNLSHHIFYTQTNNTALRNKGVNEAMSMIEGLKMSHFSPNDMMIKITGRYCFKDDSFIRLVETHPEIDIFIKRDSHSTAFTGCYAIRYKHLLNFLNNLDLAKMERYMICIEREFDDYVKQVQKKGIRVFVTDNLGITANIFGEGIPQLTHW